MDKIIQPTAVLTKRQQSIRRELEENIDQVYGHIITPRTHVQKHTPCTDAQMMDALLKKIVDGAPPQGPAAKAVEMFSQFTRPENLDADISDLLYYHAGTIAGWASRWGTPEATRYLAVKAELEPDTPIGRTLVYNGDSIREYEATNITAVLSRDRKGSFYLVTAYPDLAPKDAKATGRDLLPDVLASETFKAMDIEDQIHILNAAGNPNPKGRFTVRKNPEGGRAVIRFERPEPNGCAHVLELSTTSPEKTYRYLGPDGEPLPLSQDPRLDKRMLRMRERKGAPAIRQLKFRGMAWPHKDMEKVFKRDIGTCMHLESALHPQPPKSPRKKPAPGIRYQKEIQACNGCQPKTAPSPEY